MAADSGAREERSNQQPAAEGEQREQRAREPESVCPICSSRVLAAIVPRVSQPGVDGEITISDEPAAGLPFVQPLLNSDPHALRVAAAHV